MGIASFLSLLPIIQLIVPISNPDQYLKGHFFASSLAWIGFLRFFRITTIFHFVRLRNSIGPNVQPFDTTIAFQLNEISFQVSKLVVSIAVFVFLATGTVFALTVYDANAYELYHHPMTWGDCLYFVLVTVTTVGYGDIIPVSTSARILTILIIVIGFGTIPVQAAALVHTITSKPAYIGSFTKPHNAQHICLCGIVDYELLSRFLTELYDPTHAPSSVGQNLVVAILSPTKPTDAVSLLLRLSVYKSRVHYFIGSSKSFADLHRIQLESSTAVYVIADSVTRSLRGEEDSVFLSAIAITKYLRQTCGPKRNHFLLSQDVQQSCCLGTDLLPRRICNRIAVVVKCMLGLVGSPGDAYSSPEVSVSDNYPMKTDTLGRASNGLHPRTVVKLTSAARSRPVLESAGIDVVLSLQVCMTFFDRLHYHKHPMILQTLTN